MMQRIIIFSLLILISFKLSAQDDLLDNYINEALENNITLQQKNYSYHKSLETLKESKRMFMPTVSFEARYTIAEGGREIEVPFGDMINPAYNNLNLINQNLGINAPTYPTIENSMLNFMRPTEHETKIQAAMPLFNSSIIQNHKIRQDYTEVESINIEIYKRELVQEVKTAYYQYLQAEKIYQLQINTLEIVERNLANRESLYKNHKITIDQVYAAKAQVKEKEKDLASANKNKMMATAWFNFLLNKDYNTEIKTSDLQQVKIVNYQLDDLKNASVENREELKQVDKYLEINDKKTNLEKGNALPKVNLAAAYGFQGETYQFDSEHDFAFLSISLSWTIFNSGQRKSKVQQSKIDYQITKSKKEELERKMELDAINAYYEQQNALKGVELAQQEVENYQKMYNLVEKKYIQGMVNFLEYSSALNNKVAAETKLILAEYTYIIEQIKIERLVSGYQF